MLSPEWRPPAALPRPEMPGDSVARLVWLVTTAAPAGPWLPTVAEQDAAWLATYGDAVERLQRNQHNARAYGSLTAAPGTVIGGHL